MSQQQSRNPIRYLGIDPGTTRIGYGVIESVRGNLTPVTWGIIENPGVNDALDKQHTLEAMSELIAEHKPARAAVERLFFMNNQKTAMSVSEMRGVILVALAQGSVPITELNPLQVKQSVCGHGGAGKQQVHDMVRMILGIKVKITPDDASDALALALCAATASQQY